MKNNILNVYKKYKNIFNVLFAFFGTTGVLMIYDHFSDVNIYNCFVNIIIFSGLISLYTKSNDFKKYNLFSIFFSILLSTITVLGTHLELTSNIDWGIKLVFNILFLSFAFIPLINLCCNKVFKIKATEKKFSFIKYFIILFILNLIAFLAMCPGVYHYDAGFQIMQIIKSNVQITTHFSYVYCLLIGKLVELGKYLFNSYAAGFGIFIFLQSVLLTFVYTKIISFINKRHESKLFNTILILFFGIFPFCTVMAMSATQDTIFAAFFALTLIILYKIYEDENEIAKNSTIIKFSICALMLCLIRNNGVYLLYLSLPISIIFIKKYRLRALAMFATPILLLTCYNKVLLPKIGVIKGDTIREMTSVPTQQLARVYTYDGLTDDEYDILDNYYNVDNFKYYDVNPSIADMMKSGLYEKYAEENLKDYLIFWLKIGKHHPVNYIEAFLMNTLSWWYPNKNYYDSRMYHEYLQYNMLDAKAWNKNYIEIKRHSLIKPYDNFLTFIIEDDNWIYIPIINTLFTFGLYTIIIIFSLLINLINKKYSIILPYSFILGLLLTLFVAPGTISRYYYPLLIIIPICISDINLIKNKQLKTKK